MLDNIKQLLFVCSGNTCRGPMAEMAFNYIAEQKGIEARAISRACYVRKSVPEEKESEPYIPKTEFFRKYFIGDTEEIPEPIQNLKISENSAVALCIYGVPVDRIIRHKAQGYSFDDIISSDFVFTMTKDHLKAITRELSKRDIEYYPSMAALRYFTGFNDSIPDPIGKNVFVYLMTLEKILQSLDVLFSPDFDINHPKVKIPDQLQLELDSALSSGHHTADEPKLDTTDDEFTDRLRQMENFILRELYPIIGDLPDSQQEDKILKDRIKRMTEFYRLEAEASLSPPESETLPSSSDTQPQNEDIKKRNVREVKDCLEYTLRNFAIKRVLGEILHDKEPIQGIEDVCDAYIGLHRLLFPSDEGLRKEIIQL